MVFIAALLGRLTISMNAELDDLIDASLDFMNLL